MKSNKLHLSLALCLLVLLSLFFLSLVPSFYIGPWQFKKIDLLSAIRIQQKDVLQTETDVVQTDSIAKIDSLVTVMKAGCSKGLQCIEDYSADSTAMNYFLEALVHHRQSRKPLRIAMYGDSFIEGDIFCGSLRDTLQTLFGGQGVGYVPITSEVPGFRNTIRHAFENWKTYSLVNKDSTVSVDMGPSGYCFIPQPGNWVEYRPSKQRYLRKFSGIKLYYRNTGQAIITYTVNDSITLTETLKRSNRLNEWRYNHKNTRKIRFQFQHADSLQLYGASFEDSKGIYVDNFSMRGNSGIILHNVADNMYEEFNRYRDYKLIILQYGLNVVRDDSVRFSWYASKMIRVVNKLKSVFPKASILLISVSDKSTNVSGDFKTMKTIPALRNAQRYIAKQTGIAFWDLYEAMGGENSMVKFVESKPALAAKDYTHLTFKGGKKLAGSLVKSILYKRERYERQEVLY